MTENAQKLAVLPENDVHTQIPSVELADTMFCGFSEIFFRIARLFFEKCVIFGALYLATQGFPVAQIAHSE